MAKDDEQLNAAKRAYRTAAEVGNREEEARWANLIGNILKNRGEYVKALKWLRIDYDVSVKFLPQKQSLATCQSLGEVHLRLLHFEDALKYQLCECPGLFARLEVLNISGNRLGDGCGQFLSTLLDKRRALYNLDIAHCCISSTAIEKMANAIPSGSVLSHLSIGYNKLCGKDITVLLTKLASLERFSELNINGIEVNKPAIDGICQLAERTCLSRLMLGSTDIGNEGAVRITESMFSKCKEFVKLDLSYCGFTATYIYKLNSYGNMVAGIVELNLEGNPLGEEGTSAITSLLTNPKCRLEVLILNKCQLELSGLVQVIKALSENKHMVELRTSHNITKNHKYSTNFTTSKSSEKKSQPVSIEQLEVADSEDELTGEEANNAGFTKSAPEDRFIKELWTAIGQAKKLQLLDLSNNGFPIEVAQVLYGAWSSRSECDRFCKHIKEDPFFYG